MVRDYSLEETEPHPPSIQRGASSSFSNHEIYLDHRHDQEHAAQTQVTRKLRVAFAIIAVFLAIEVIGGYWAQSLAIWSDAAHLLADLAAMGVALIAAHLGSFPVSDVHTFGLKRVESLGALVSTLSLLCISVGLAVEAVRRLLWHASSSAATVVNGRLMSIIAFMGLLVNVALACVLGEHHVHLPSDDGCHSHSHDHGREGHEKNHSHAHEHQREEKEAGHSHDHGHSHAHEHQSEVESAGHSHGHDHERCDKNGELLQVSKMHSESTPLLSNSKSTTKNGEKPPKQQRWQVPFLPQNINLQAAYLHVLGDLAQSFAVFLAGCVIWIVPSWTIVDPICTLLFCCLVFYSALGVLQASVAVLLQQVPSHLNYQRIRERIAKVEGVHNVHELHIWSISHRVPALTVHCTILCPDGDTTTSANYNKSMHDAVLEQIYEVVSREFGIIHATIQIQSLEGDCITCVDRLCRPCIEEADTLSRRSKIDP